MKLSIVSTVAALLLTSFFLSSCIEGGPGSGTAKKAETPKEAIGEISELLQKGDFESLIRKRYAEIGKAENEEQIQQLIGKFEKEFGSPERVKAMVSKFNEAKSATPTFTNDGKTAIFEASFGELKLSKMDSGLWGFHL